MKLWLVFALCLALPRIAVAEVVASIRYYQREGVSHYRLYLFSDDGRPVRRLTSPGRAHDVMPVFAADGKTVTFKRVTRDGATFFRIGRDGKNLTPLPAQPEWWEAQTKPLEHEHSPPGEADAKDRVRYPSPDQRWALIASGDPDMFRDEQVWLREISTNTETPLKQLPGFEGFSWPVGLGGTPWLTLGKRPVVFIYQHRGSTDGSCIQVVDPEQRKVVPLAPNGSEVFPMPERGGFFAASQERYQPFFDTGKTVNCSYLDYWTADLQRTRYARGISIFGGGSWRDAKGHRFVLRCEPDYLGTF